MAVLQSRLRMGRAVVGDVIGRAVSLALVLLVAGLDLGFYAVLAAAAGGAAATLASPGGSRGRWSACALSATARSGGGCW